MLSNCFISFCVLQTELIFHFIFCCIILKPFSQPWSFCPDIWYFRCVRSSHSEKPLKHLNYVWQQEKTERIQDSWPITAGFLRGGVIWVPTLLIFSLVRSLSLVLQNANSKALYSLPCFIVGIREINPCIILWYVKSLKGPRGADTYL